MESRWYAIHASRRTALTECAGQSIAVVRDPPSIAIHSIQDGHRVLVLPVADEGRSIHLSGVWWFKDEKNFKNGSNIPDIFKREHIIVRCSFWLIGRLYDITLDRFSTFSVEDASTAGPSPRRIG